MDLQSSVPLIPEGVLEDLIVAEERTCREISGADVRAAVAAMPASGAGVLALVSPYLQRRDSRVLDIGCGNGFGLCYLLRAGARAVGIEPGRTTSFEGRSHRAAEILRANGFDPRRHFVTAVAEELPFASGSFDVVVGAAVLEHVQDLDAAVRESVRVTRPGGVIVMTVPNYDSFYEPHYRSLWLPYLLRSKGTARWWVRRVLRRPTYYVDELNFTNAARLRMAVERSPGVQNARIYGLLGGPLASLSAVHYHLARPQPSTHGWLETIRRAGPIRHVAAGLFGLTITMLAACGLAPMLLLVCEVVPEGAPRRHE